MSYYFKDGKVVATARYVLIFSLRSKPFPTFAGSMGRDPLNTQISELMRLGLMPSAAEIKAGKVCEDIDAVNSELTFASLVIQNPLQIALSLSDIKLSDKK